MIFQTRSREQQQIHQQGTAAYNNKNHKRHSRPQHQIHKECKAPRMSFSSRMSKAFENALILPLSTDSKYILFSDCHRGDGRADDNFLKNELLYLAALRYYNKRAFTYLELGDGDELWENRSIERIQQMHPHSFEMLKKFKDEHRMHLIYGNHDMVKKDAEFCNKYMDVPSYPGILLKDELHKKDIFLTHGHQAQIMNSTYWKVNRFFVRYLWKNLELLGVPDPTSAAKNNTRKGAVEQRLTQWAAKQQVILIAGHTHRPFAGTKQSPYFNTGSCVHPAGITGIEIENRCMTLVKWSLDTRPDQVIFVKREALGNTVCVDQY